MEADNISPPWRFQVVLFLAPWSQRQPDRFWFFSSVASTNNTGQDTSLLIHLVYTWDVRSEMVPGCQHDWNDSQPSFSFFFFFVVPGGRQRLHSESKVYRESKRRWCHYSMAITLCNEQFTSWWQVKAKNLSTASFSECRNTTPLGKEVLYWSKNTKLVNITWKLHIVLHLIVYIGIILVLNWRKKK